MTDILAETFVEISTSMLSKFSSLDDWNVSTPLSNTCCLITLEESELTRLTGATSAHPSPHTFQTAQHSPQSVNSCRLCEGVRVLCVLGSHLWIWLHWSALREEPRWISLQAWWTQIKSTAKWKVRIVSPPVDKAAENSQSLSLFKCLCLKSWLHTYQPHNNFHTLVIRLYTRSQRCLTAAWRAGGKVQSGGVKGFSCSIF